MRLVRNLALVISAICVIKALVAAFLILLSIPPMFFELSASETELRVTYEILMAYFLIVVVLLFITSVSLFNQATNRQAFQINFALVTIALAISGSHLAVAIVGDAGSLLVQAAQSSIWVPVLICFATLTSFLIARSTR